jgi:hypothetical protein
MKKTLLTGLATLLFLLTSTGIAKDWPLAQEDLKNSKVTGLYDNVTILQEQINTLTERLGRIETLHTIGPRFTDMEDGTIKDNDTGVIWLKNANCFEWKNWSDAQAAAASLRQPQCGLTDFSREGDWKLPTKAEWEAFMSNVYRGPALVNTVGDGQWSEGDAFYDVDSEAYFWSRTAEDADSAWFAYVGNGETYVDQKTDSMYIWPVRKEHRFKDMGDGTIRDNVSGLIWLKDASCGDLPRADASGQANWEDANAGAAELGGGRGNCKLQDGSEPGDWRLPTIAEWLSFMTPRYTAPALVDTRGDARWSEGDAFTGVESDRYHYYWSSTTLRLDPSWAEAAYMNDYAGETEFDKSQILNVWPVRNDN